MKRQFIILSVVLLAITTASGQKSISEENNIPKKVELIDNFSRFSLEKDTTITDGSFVKIFEAATYLPDRRTSDDGNNVSNSIQLENDLQILPEFPYLQFPYGQIPISQNRFITRVKNAASAPQTQVVFSASVNNVAAGVSEPLPLLAPNETSQELIIDHAPLVVGNNAIRYTVSSEQAEETPNDNTILFNVKGSKIMYAAEGLTAFTTSFGGTAPISFGQVYTITNQDTLTGAAIAFYNREPLNFSISLYRTIGRSHLDGEPIFTVPATRNATGLSLFALPETPLPPGNYYLGINQLTERNIEVTYDYFGGASYFKTGSRLDQLPNATVIRMLLKASHLTTNLTNLNVVPAIGGATFSWETNNEDALLYKVTLDVNDVPYIFITSEKSIYIRSIPAEMTIKWTVQVMYDAVQYGEPVNGPDFIVPDCKIVTTFPLVEDFEANTDICWTTPNFKPVNGKVYGGHFSNICWMFTSYYTTPDLNDRDGDAWLISPELAVTAETKTLQFWYQKGPAPSVEKFKVGYSTGTNSLAEFNWRDDITIPTDNSDWILYTASFPANTKYLGFYYYSDSQFYMSIDDIVINTGTISEINSPLSTDASVYPTITTGKLTVKTPSAATIKVLDISGRNLAEYQSNGELNLDLNYANGVYLIRVNNGKKTSLYKVILQK